MTSYNYKKLQNGSDIRGIALPGVEGEDVNLDSIAASRIAKSFLFWLSKYVDKKPSDISIAIGHDSRLSASDLNSALSEALLQCGATVLDSGLSSTPAMFMSTIFDEYKADGSIMITASHLPFNRNGFKFFSADGGLDKGDITDIIIFAESDSTLNSMPPMTDGTVKKIPLMDTYSAHLRKIIADGIDSNVSEEKLLSGMKIVVDAGNGSGGFYAEKVLKPLGADVSASQFLEPNGHFPNHAPNPEDKKAMESITLQVKKTHADLGLIFDTDVDRSSAVDENGKEINRNGIVAMAASLISDRYPGTTVVTDSITSNHLTRFLENTLNVKHLRFKRGYKNVINKSKELCDSGIDSQLAIETSGHAAFKENYFLDDGAYLAAKIVIKAANLFQKGEKVSSVLSSLTEPVEATEMRFPITCEDFGPYGDMVLDEFTVWANNNSEKHGITIVDPNYEGVRLDFNNKDVNGWCLLRKSLHDPIMPLNIESDNPNGCEIIKKYLMEFLINYDSLKIN